MGGPSTGVRRGVREKGFIEGRNVAIEFHQADGDTDRLSALIAGLVRRRVSVIVTNDNATLAAKAATATIPIVFTAGGDPVELGVVASLNRPAAISQVLWGSEIRWGRSDWSCCTKWRLQPPIWESS